MLLSQFLEYVPPNSKKFPEARKEALRKKGFRVSKTGKIIDISNLPYDKKLKILLNRRKNNKGQVTALYPKQKEKEMMAILNDYDEQKVLEKHFVNKKSTDKKPYTTPKLGEKKKWVKPKAVNVEPPNIPTNTSVSKAKGIPYKKLALAGGISLAGGLGYAAYMNRKERSDKGKKRGRYRT